MDTDTQAHPAYANLFATTNKTMYPASSPGPTDLSILRSRWPLRLETGEANPLEISFECITAENVGDSARTLEQKDPSVMRDFEQMLWS
jgi:hypothetical protein